MDNLKFSHNDFMIPSSLLFLFHPHTDGHATEQEITTQGTVLSMIYRVKDRTNPLLPGDVPQCPSYRT